jgi:amino-acid N-acetyltransferase
MAAPSITLRRATPPDVDRIVSLLDANDLPHSDVRANPECFFVARSGSEVVGVGGVEVYGPAGLLRSVAVAEPVRGQGYGTAVCDELERHALDDGVDVLYLLTTTASEFFRARGYEEVPRAEAPASIRETTEFADLCPASATCMRGKF